MKRTPENEPTHPRIFRSGVNGTLQARGFGGVDPDNWKFNPDTQNYDYIGQLDEIDSASVLPEQPIGQKTPIIKDVPQIK